jgi:hypothetical protein
MALLPYDINAFIQADPVITSLAGGTIDISAFLATEDCGIADFYGKPIMRFHWMPNINSAKKYFLRNDRIRYYIMDRNYDRMMGIGERMVEILDQEQRAQILIPSIGGTNVIMWSRILNSQTIQPTERDGMAQFLLDFEFKYTVQTMYYA